MKLSRAVQEFVADCLARGLARSTAEAYAGDLQELVSLAKPDSTVTVGPNLLQLYMLTLRSRAMAPATVARKQATLRAFSRWGLQRRLWTQDPSVSLVRPSYPERLPRPFQRDEMVRLMGLTLPPVERIVRALLYYTGLRVTSVCLLRVADLSFAEVTFEEGTRFPGTLRSLGKGQKPLVTPMHPVLKDVLLDWVLQETDLKGQSYVISRGGRPYTRRGIALMTRRWGQEAGVPDCTPHRFRHSFATDLLREGTDVRVIQRLLAHANITTTMLYTRVSDRQAGEAILRLPRWQ